MEKANTQNRLFDTFVFDLDGTLLDTLPDLVVLTNRALRESGFPERTAAEIKSFVGNGARALMYQAVPQNASDDDVDRAMERWIALYPTAGIELTTPYPHMLEALQQLKNRGARLGVLSNKFEGGVLQVIGAYMPELFSVQHGEGPTIPRKPNPTGLLRTIRELGSSPNRTAYVGDSPGDIEAARNAGTFAIAVSWGYHDKNRLQKAQPDAMIDNPLELLEFAKD